MIKYITSNWKFNVVVIVLLLSLVLNATFIFSRHVPIALIPAPVLVLTVSTPAPVPILVLTVSTPAPVPILVLTVSTPASFAKQDILLDMQAGKGIEIWIDNVDVHILSVTEVEGVIGVTKSNGGFALYVRVDPRYDKAAVAGEILEMLTSKVVTNVW